VRSKLRKCTIRGQVRWEVDGIDPISGRRTRPRFETRAEALAYLDQAARQPRPAMVPALTDPTVTVQRFAADWLCTQIAAGVWTTPGTIAAYREHLWQRICVFRLNARTVFGDLKVRDVQRAHVHALVASMRQGGFAPRTTAATYRLLHQLLERAASAGLLAQHPIDRDFWRTQLKPLLRIPKDTMQVKAFTEAQARAFLAITQERSRLHDFYVTGFLSGGRLRELCGLQLDDLHVNLVQGQRVRQLAIVRQLLRGSTSHPVTGPPKGGQSRQVDVGQDLARVLERLLRERPGLAMRHGWRPVPSWVFVTRTGCPLDGGAVEKDFKRMLTLAGLGSTELTPHSMRHSFATWHIMRGRNAKWIQQQLGHASIAFTFDVYGDWFKIADAQAADQLGHDLVGTKLVPDA
jgi:integrase